MAMLFPYPDNDGIMAMLVLFFSGGTRIANVTASYLQL